MNLKKLTSVSLAAASLTTQLGDLAKNFKNVEFVQPAKDELVLNSNKLLIIPNAYPVPEEEDDEKEIKPSVYIGGFLKYGYKYIRAFIVAHDEKHAVLAASTYKNLCDQLTVDSSNSKWNMGVGDTPVSEQRIFDEVQANKIIVTLGVGGIF
jgi:hypothetical protein